MRGLVDRFRTRFGDFWWYSLLLFLATRVGDLINAYIGLWLVPKYVPSEELGAVLPLTQFAMTIALPVSVFGMAFMKYVNVLAEQGERGRVKSLLRGVFVAIAVVFVLAIVVVHFTITPVLERLHIEKGMLGFLIIATGLIGAVAPIYTNALQALKRFHALSLMTVLGAPIRLVVMLVLMPLRAVSGYFAAGMVVGLWQIACSVFSLRKELGGSVESRSFWTKNNTRAFLKYALFVLLYYVPMLAQFAEMLIIRQRLSSVDSAAYYMISRFAEIGTYAGATLIAVLFPYVSEAAQKGDNPDRILVRTTLISLGFGVICAGGFLGFGHWLFVLLPGGAAYMDYVPQLALLTLVLSLIASLNCAIMGELAAERYGFLIWYVPLHLVYTAVLFCISGYGYFSAWLPQSCSAFLTRINDYGLNWVLSAMLLLQVLKLAGVFTPVVWRKLRSQG